MKQTQNYSFKLQQDKTNGYLKLLYVYITFSLTNNIGYVKYNFIQLVGNLNILFTFSSKQLLYNVSLTSEITIFNCSHLNETFIFNRRFLYLKHCTHDLNRMKTLDFKSYISAYVSYHDFLIKRLQI